MIKKRADHEFVSQMTFTYDNLRNLFQGILEGGFSTFAILIAIRAFSAESHWKSTIAAAGYAGLLIAPLTVHLAAKLKNTPATKICSFFFLAVAICLMLSTIVPSLHAYIAGMIAAKFIFKQQVPLMLGVYGHNYNKHERGQRVSYSLMILPISAMIFGYVGSKILDIDINFFPIIILCMSIGAIGCAITMLKIPSRPVEEQEHSSLLGNLKLIFKDKFFCKILILLSILGIDNQMTIPLRIEYLANSDTFQNLPNWLIVLTVSIIPATFRIISSRIWGILFDKFHMITIAILANVFFVFGFWIFFNSIQLKYIILSEILIGIGHGGGLLLWCLWITKIVPVKQYSAYMGANTAVVGMRNILAPFIGYAILESGCSFAALGKIASSIIFLSIIGLISIKNHPRFKENY